MDIQFEAIIDIKAAYDWYERKRTGLGDELIEDIEFYYELIAEYPQSHGFLRFNGINTRYSVSD